MNEIYYINRIPPFHVQFSPNMQVLMQSLLHCRSGLEGLVKENPSQYSTATSLQVDSLPVSPASVRQWSSVARACGSLAFITSPRISSIR